MINRLQSTLHSDTRMQIFTRIAHKLGFLYGISPDTTAGKCTFDCSGIRLQSYVFKYMRQIFFHHRNIDVFARL